MQTPLLIFSLHGANWDGLSDFLEDSKMPWLRNLVASGSSGDLRSVQPTLQFPNWASFWTGKSPAEHMLFSHGSVGPDRRFIRPVDRSFLTESTWLEVAARNGRRAVSLFAPLTNPPPTTTDSIVLCEHRQGGQLVSAPSSMAQETSENRGKCSRPAVGLPFVSNSAVDGDASDLAAIDAYLDQQIDSIKHAQSMAEQVVTLNPADVILVHFAACDPIGHALWHGIDRKHIAFDEAIHRRVGRFYSSVDGAMSQIAELTQPASVLVFSEHGFSSCSAILSLARHLSETTSLELVASPANQCCMAAEPSAKSSAYLENKAIYIDQTLATETLIDTIVETLRSVVDPKNGRPILRRVSRASDLYGPLRDPDWEVLVLDPALGYTVRNGGISQSLLTDCVANRDHWIGTHTDIGLWAFSGTNGVEPLLQDMNVMDLHPLILETLGVL